MDFSKYSSLFSYFDRFIRVVIGQSSLMLIGDVNVCKSV